MRMTYTHTNAGAALSADAGRRVALARGARTWGGAKRRRDATRTSGRREAPS